MGQADPSFCMIADSSGFKCSSYRRLYSSSHVCHQISYTCHIRPNTRNVFTCMRYLGLRACVCVCGVCVCVCVCVCVHVCFTHTSKDKKCLYLYEVFGSMCVCVCMCACVMEVLRVVSCELEFCVQEFCCLVSFHIRVIVYVPFPPLTGHLL